MAPRLGPRDYSAFELPEGWKAHWLAPTTTMKSATTMMKSATTTMKSATTTMKSPVGGTEGPPEGWRNHCSKNKQWRSERCEDLFLKY